jgi:DNA-binding winged helix-turn-helix (wHTH) protein
MGAIPRRVFGGSWGFHWDFLGVLVKIQFGPFTLDDGRRQLLEGDRDIHLSPKAYELLTVLLEQRPKAISKAELHARLWPDTFVSEVNLAALVAELRAALGEHGRHGRFIRTVHGFGYAFSGDATDVPDAIPPGPPATAAAPGGTPSPPPGRPAGSGCWLSWGDHDYVLRPGGQTVGRDRTADVRIDALSISRLHARLTCEAAGAVIEDLGSKNGTWVRGSRVATATPLEDGDEVRLGTVTLTFRNLDAPASTVTDGPRSPTSR